MKTVIDPVWTSGSNVIAAGAMVFFFLLAWLWRWAIHHGAEIKQRWTSFLEHPRVSAFRRRFASQIQFLEKRFSPHGYFGLHLTVGTVILIAASWLFGGIAEDVLTGDRLVRVDRKVAVWFSEHATPGLDALITVLTYLGSSVVICSISGAMAIYLIWRRHWYRLLALILIVPCGMLLNVLVKTAFHRHRPMLAIQNLTTFSFPSGHAAAATLFYGLLGFFLWTRLKSWRGRVSTILITLFLVFLVDFTRVYLRVHYLSDVLAANAVGLAWLTLCLTSVETLRRRNFQKNNRHPF